MRAVEATAIRLKDIDFSLSPTRIRIRKEYAKTRVARDIYISDEATMYLKQWIDWKYRNKTETKEKGVSRMANPDDLVFSIYSINEKKSNPQNLYQKLLQEFQKLLLVSGMVERKESGIHKRRKITLHSLRRFGKTVISDQTNQDYSEWFLGHSSSRSPYYTKKESERREIYAAKRIKYLTSLDYAALETTGKSIEAKISEKDEQIQTLIKKQEKFEQLIRTLIDSGQ
jgi:integrase